MNSKSLNMAEPTSAVIFANSSLVFIRARYLTYRLLALLLALLYGAIISQIPNEQFKDFKNYIVYAESSWIIFLKYFEYGIMQMLANEPVWLLINAGLGNFLTAEAAVRTIIFISASTMAWLVLAHHPRQFIWLVLFLLLPMVMKNYLIHIRQGAAIAVYLIGWYSSAHRWRWLWMGMAAFVHASFFFVLALLILATMMQRLRLGVDTRAFGFVFFGVLLGISLGWLASVVSARQALEYDFSMTEVSGLGFILWCSALMIWIFEGRAFLGKYTFETGMILFYLTTYWLIEVTARIFESGLIPVLIAGLALTRWRRFGFLAIVLVLGGLSWLLRMRQEGMGFVGW